ncbi:hypothetical protein [Paenibacillus naphthalenovorans]|uniref:hypothetical protein n=1 Tax=Paenibacillus naphthalenovorans TaxID=162209 RepID=UPI003D2DEC55
MNAILKQITIILEIDSVFETCRGYLTDEHHALFNFEDVIVFAEVTKVDDRTYIQDGYSLDLGYSKRGDEPIFEFYEKLRSMTGYDMMSRS